tara:strand:+ start:266 stop:616 length:351 start_codon:yes stop_codon:yes gene_type:complete
MGLDQYVFEVPPNHPPDEPVPELFYWRKHADLQGWMEQLWRRKENPPEDASMNCMDVELTMDDIVQLESVYDQLPYTTGFFFGKSGVHSDQATARFIKKAKASLRKGNKLFYTADW